MIQEEPNSLALWYHLAFIDLLSVLNMGVAKRGKEFLKKHYSHETIIDIAQDLNYDRKVRSLFIKLIHGGYFTDIAEDQNAPERADGGNEEAKYFLRD